MRGISILKLYLYYVQNHMRISRTPTIYPSFSRSPFLCILIFPFSPPHPLNIHTYMYRIPPLYHLPRARYFLKQSIHTSLSHDKQRTASTPALSLSDRCPLYLYTHARARLAFIHLPVRIIKKTARAQGIN